MPLNVKCMNCGSAHLAPRIGVACRVCGKRMLLPVEEAEARLAVATAASEDAKKIRYETAQERWAALPAESRKLRAFISAEFKSEDRFAAYLRNIGHKCSRSMAQKILRTGQAKHSTARAIAGSKLKPEMSFTIEAPASRAASATSDFEVSTEMGISVPAASDLITGTTLRISSSGETDTEPGRVDSPPTSMKSAPSPTSSRPRRTAASCVSYNPPSEKESGVTLSTPIRWVRDSRS